jgi:hypothetical protein
VENHRSNRLDDKHRVVTTMNKAHRHTLQAQLRQRNAELLADIDQRRAFTAEHGDVEWPRAQEEPMVETSPEQPPAYRAMSDAERKPWDSWLQAAIGELREEVQDAVSIGFAERDALIDELRAEILQLRADLTRNKNWWSK